MSTSRATNDFRPILQELARQGWDVQQTNNGHYRATPPDKARQIIHFSESGHARALANTVADLRRSGFVWPPTRVVERTSVPGSVEDPTFVREVDTADMHSCLLPMGSRDTCVACHDGPPGPRPGPLKVQMGELVQTASVVDGSFGVGHANGRGLVAEKPGPPKTVDQLFAELKDARTYRQLAEDHMRECRGKLADAQREMESATQEYRVANEDLARKKEAFTAAFDEGAS